jgi:predicted Fe-Mo cluster-binding NifX family protein
MKTVITSSGDNLNSSFDLRFGRAAWFCFLNEETGETRFEVNEYAESQGGAGTKASEKMIENGVTKVISGDFGPKAKELLEKFNIQMVVLQAEENTISEVIAKLK